MKDSKIHSPDMSLSDVFPLLCTRTIIILCPPRNETGQQHTLTTPWNLWTLLVDIQTLTEYHSSQVGSNGPQTWSGR